MSIFRNFQRNINNQIESDLTPIARQLQSVEVQCDNWKNKYRRSEERRLHAVCDLSSTRKELEEARRRIAELESLIKRPDGDDDESDDDESDDEYSFREDDLHRHVDNMLTKIFSKCHSSRLTDHEDRIERKLKSRAMDMCTEIVKKCLFRSWLDNHRNKSVAAGIAYYLVDERRENPIYRKTKQWYARITDVGPKTLNQVNYNLRRHFKG
tara:strand:- start:7614 stop:8246 length:633 start_codon:yes stop_codon:yes gene_type:complete